MKEVASKMGDAPARHRQMVFAQTRKLPQRTTCALFFVAASYMAMGIFIAPLIAGREPKHQDKLALALFAAVVFVVVGVGQSAASASTVLVDVVAQIRH